MRLGVEAEGGGTHVSGNFFLGREDDRPGPLFYPVALGLRLTPWTLLGVLALPLALRRAPAPNASRPGRAGGLRGTVRGRNEHFPQQAQPLCFACLPGAGHPGCCGTAGDWRMVPPSSPNRQYPIANRLAIGNDDWYRSRSRMRPGGIRMGSLRSTRRSAVPQPARAPFCTARAKGCNKWRPG